MSRLLTNSERAVLLSVLALPTFHAATFAQDAVLGFDAPAAVVGPPGGTAEFEAFATITPAAGKGVQGWALSLTADGAEILSVTTDGLTVLTAEGEKPLDQQIFLHATELATHVQEPDRRGAVAYLAGIGYPRQHLALQPEVPHTVLRLGIRAPVPAAGERRTVTLRFEDGFKSISGGEPIENIVVDDLGSQHPLTRPLTIEIRGGDGAPFRRGDANDDGELNLSDPVFGFNHLFRGGPEPTCQSSLDANDDGELNITDPIYVILFLFRGGEPLPPPTGACGFDGTLDTLTCESFAPCN